ncbi:MAG TPA: lasso peptide biosynthesis B2 protein, partial [Solirubrobacterales bacterium]|nr:lasso peptide biosynthesis B2 protein [Solirubrobacterales bacterium]
MRRDRRGPEGRARLAAAILVAYARVRRLLLRGDLRRTVAALRERRAAAAAPLERREAVRLTRAVVRVLRLLPTDSRCLVRSLVVLAVLAERGGEVELVIGVMPGEAFAAHAWVELDGAPLLEAGVAGDG